MADDEAVLEVAIIDVLDGADGDFAAAYRQARSILAETTGVRSVRMTHGVERPTRFVLLVEWDSIQVHNDNFRSTDRWVQWRDIIGPYFATPPVVEHFADVL